jgi:DNA-directed RNA polymerase specialized sigma24 family protein
MRMEGVVRSRRADGEEPESKLQKTMKALLLSNISGWKQREQIALLDRAGFGQTDIAELLGTTSKAVSVRLAEIRKEARTSRR